MRLKERVNQNACGHWDFILSSNGIDPIHLRKGHRPCPICGGSDRFRCIDPNNATFYCGQCGGPAKTGGSLSGFDLIMHRQNWSFFQCLQEVEKLLGGTHPDVSREYIPTPAPKVDLSRYERMLRTWNEGESIVGTATERYLESRGLAASIPYLLDVRHHRNLRYIDYPPDGSTNCHWRQGMIAVFRNPAGEIVQIHQTFLNKDGIKAFEKKSKQMMRSYQDGATAGGAIRLFPPEEIMGVAEGIETAIAARLLFNMPVWSCHSAPLLKKFVPPPEVKALCIFADNDSNGVGERAAEVLDKRMIELGIETQIELPPKVDTDFADYLLQLNKQSEKTA